MKREGSSSALGGAAVERPSPWSTDLDLGAIGSGEEPLTDGGVPVLLEGLQQGRQVGSFILIRAGHAAIVSCPLIVVGFRPTIGMVERIECVRQAADRRT